VYGTGMKVNNASYVGYLGAGNTFASGAASDFCVRSDNVLSFAAGGPYERMRLDTSGNLLVGATANGQPDANYFMARDASGFQANIGHVTGTASGQPYVYMVYGGIMIGSITQSGTAAVLYNTTSDYRLKTVVGAVTGQGSRIDALKPIDYQWKDGNVPARGFLAHEFQTVYPSSVSGDKDAVDADGKPVYQAMQASTSEVIADLVAELQSLRARVAQLESKS